MHHAVAKLEALFVLRQSLMLDIALRQVKRIFLLQFYTSYSAIITGKTLILLR